MNDELKPGAHHLTAENIVAVVADLEACAEGTETVSVMDRDWRTQSGILAKIIRHLAARPVADAGEAVFWYDPTARPELIGALGGRDQIAKLVGSTSGPYAQFTAPLYRAAPSARTLELTNDQIIEIGLRVNGIEASDGGGYFLPITFARAILAAASAPADPWHDAVLAECMSIEGGYNQADPVATVRALIDWHVQTDRDLATSAPAEAPSVRDQTLEEAARAVDALRGQADLTYKAGVLSDAAAAIRALQGKPEALAGMRIIADPSVPPGAIRVTSGPNSVTAVNVGEQEGGGHE